MWLDRAPFYAVALLAVGLAVPAAANHEGKTEPKGGAVSLPPGTELGAPFERGREVRITSGYGPDGGSSYHDGLDDACCTNDHYALDFALNDRPNNGKGEPVVAAADGIVRKAGTGTKGWSSYGLRVYIEHDFGDGHRYISLYAHLDSLAVDDGDRVRRGERIGTLGGSCYAEGSVDRACFGAHLHFAIHRDSTLGGKGTGGSYGGEAVVPEPMDGQTGLHADTRFVSKNGGRDYAAAISGGVDVWAKLEDAGRAGADAGGGNGRPRESSGLDKSRPGGGTEPAEGPPTACAVAPPRGAGSVVLLVLAVGLGVLRRRRG